MDIMPKASTSLFVFVSLAERDDVEFICKTCGCLPIANIDTFHPEKLGKAELVQEVSFDSG